MIFEPSDYIYDTLVDTHKIYVSMKHYFKVREINNEGLIYLFVTGSKERERINTQIRVSLKDWDLEKSRIKSNSFVNKDLNLVLDNIDSKITKIKTAYRLSERVLTPKILKKELSQNTPRVSFMTFFKNALEHERSLMEPSTYKRHFSIYKKLLKFKEDILFSDLNHQLIDEYRIWCKLQNNASTTIASNIASIKKFIGLAKKAGIHIALNLDEVKVGNMRGNRTSLNVPEIKRLYKYYKSEFIKDTDRLVTGYFLFGCMTGLRISDLQNLKREQLSDNQVTFISKKKKKDQSISMNEIAQDIVSFEKDLFVLKFTDQYLNKQIKAVCLNIGITKKVSFHVSRHTFATTYLRAGGKIEKLRLLLGHDKLETTMIYSHIVAAEANEDIFRLDALLR